MYIYLIEISLKIEITPRIGDRAAVLPQIYKSLEWAPVLLKSRLHCVNLTILNKGSCQKTGFFWEISPKCGWVGWLTPKQGPNPSKPPQIAPKIALFDPNFTFRSPKSHKNPGVGKQIWERSPKKPFFYTFPKKLIFLLLHIACIAHAEQIITNISPVFYQHALYALIKEIRYFSWLPLNSILSL